MKKIIFCLIFFNVFIYDILQGEKNIIACHFDSVSLRNVLMELNKRYEINFVFNDQLLNNKIVSCECDGDSLDVILDSILLTRGLDYLKLNKNTIVIIPKKMDRTEKTGLKVIADDKRRFSKDYIMAKPKYKKKPEYPPLAKKLNLQGSVLLRALISREGKVLNVSVIKSSKHRVLDNAAAIYIKKMEFEPAKFDSKPIVGSYKIEIRYLFDNK